MIIGCFSILEKKSAKEKMFKFPLYHIPDQQGCVRFNHSGKGQQYKLDGSLLVRTLSPKFDHWGGFRRTLSPITSPACLLVNSLKGGQILN
jgi:hypothetical protein